MESKVVASFEEAVAGVADGSSILVAGFGEPGTPHNLVAALYEQGASDLTLIANGAGGPREDGIITTGNLVAEGRVSRVILAFTASTHPSRRTPLEELNEAGKIEAQITPQGTLAERIRAGGAGIPAFYTPAGVGTEVAEGKEHREFGGRTYVLEEAIVADYALIRCWKADTFGNLVFRRSQRNFNPIMAMAADCTLVEAEEVVEVGELDPDLIHTPGIFVQRVVSIPEAGGMLQAPPLAMFSGRPRS
ncbi:MAG: 3-oxoacid CoA-transferase subunit A [Dehalococcoidia bacterium]|nr:3-oxoacid CoA-transferase subunit A [Dehalococcoidia bacterium]